jgi:hypothetical protein
MYLSAAGDALPFSTLFETALFGFRKFRLTIDAGQGLLADADEVIE